MTRNADFKTLGLSPDANWDDVKRAFRQLARRYHPDVAGPDGTRKFAEITEAYVALKATVSAGGRMKASEASANRDDAAPAEAPGTESIFRILWRKLFSRKRSAGDRVSADAGMSPARARFIGSVISRAEAEMSAVLSRRDEFEIRNMTDAIVRRLRSRHPGVVILALRRLSPRTLREEITQAILDYFRRNAPTSDVLERVLELLSESPRRAEFARILSVNCNKFADSDANTILRYFRNWKLTKEHFSPFLAHKTPAVVALALNCWPEDASQGGRNELVSLLKRDEELILIPLLRLLRRSNLPPVYAARVKKLMKENPNPAVRVWASAIVRDQNLS
jgi:hypothetical protein